MADSEQSPACHRRPSARHAAVSGPPRHTAVLHCSGTIFEAAQLLVGCQPNLSHCFATIDSLLMLPAQLSPCIHLESTGWRCRQQDTGPPTQPPPCLMAPAGWAAFRVALLCRGSPFRFQLDAAGGRWRHQGAGELAQPPQHGRNPGAHCGDATFILKPCFPALEFVALPQFAHRALEEAWG